MPQKKHHTRLEMNSPNFGPRGEAHSLPTALRDSKRCQARCFSPRTVAIGRYHDRAPTPAQLELNQRRQMSMVHIDIWFQ